VGAGYFGQFHLDGWARVPDVELVAVCDEVEDRARAAAWSYGVPNVYRDEATMLARDRPDFIDIVTPPSSHQALCRLAGEARVHVLCQKALAPTFADACAVVSDAERAGIRLMVHDNFRFQPWHRELRKLLDAGEIGRLHSISCRTRLGDGWGPDAYLSRQPYFLAMPQLLIFETGVHFIDLYRYLAGEVKRVFARLRRLNPAIAGEDCGLVTFEFESGAEGVWDANRFNESLSPDPRYTFGEFLLEGDGGSLRLDEEGRILVQPLGATPREHAYVHVNRGFAGDCVHATLLHFVERLRAGEPFETEGRAYLRTLSIQEAVYASAATRGPVDVIYSG